MVGRCRLALLVLEVGVAVLPDARQPEVGDSDPPTVIHEYVFRFEIAVNKLYLMSGGQPFARADEHLDHGLPGALFCGEPGAQVRALYQFDRDEHVVPPCPSIQDREHIAVRQLGHCAGFAHQPLVVDVSRTRAEQLDRYLAIQSRVVRCIDGPYPAKADALDQYIPAHHGARLQS